eukprot:jgi/Pico_ML_1/51981/g2764.t1
MESPKEEWSGVALFEQVQKILEANKELIGRINANHDSRDPERLQENVALIRELNGNISRVVEIYRHVSVDLQESMDKDSTHAS